MPMIAQKYPQRTPIEGIAYRVDYSTFPPKFDTFSLGDAIVDAADSGDLERFELISQVHVGVRAGRKLRSHMQVIYARGQARTMISVGRELTTTEKFGPQLLPGATAGPTRASGLDTDGKSNGVV